MRNLYKNVVCLKLVSGKLQVSMNLNFFNAKSTSSTVLLMPNNAHFLAKEYFSCCRMNFLTSSHLACLLLHQIRFPNYYARFLRLLFVVFIFFFFRKSAKLISGGGDLIKNGVRNFSEKNKRGGGAVTLFGTDEYRGKIFIFCEVEIPIHFLYIFSFPRNIRTMQQIS